jgi:hypothetical protein
MTLTDYQKLLGSSDDVELDVVPGGQTPKYKPPRDIRGDQHGACRC